MSGRWRSVRSLPAPSLFVPLRQAGFLNLFFEPAQVRYSGHITYGRVRMDGTTGQGQFSVDLRQHPRLRVSAPFVCSFSRLGLAKWLGRGGDGIGVVFDVSMRGAKVMSESGIQRGDRVSVTLALPNQVSPMTVEEATVRWEKEQVYGLEFVDLSPVAEMRLRKFITIATKPGA